MIPSFRSFLVYDKNFSVIIRLPWMLVRHGRVPEYHFRMHATLQADVLIEWVMYAEKIIHLQQEIVLSTIIWHLLSKKWPLLFFYTKKFSASFRKKDGVIWFQKIFNSELSQNMTEERVKFTDSALKWITAREHRIISVCCTSKPAFY